jgi:hypothetical protein
MNECLVIHNEHSTQMNAYSIIQRLNNRKIKS